MVKVQCLSIELAQVLIHWNTWYGETFVILYVHPLIFLRFFLSLQKFSLIFMNMQMR